MIYRCIICYMWLLIYSFFLYSVINLMIWDTIIMILSILNHTKIKFTCTSYFCRINHCTCWINKFKAIFTLICFIFLVKSYKELFTAKLNLSFWFILILKYHSVAIGWIYNSSFAILNFLRNFKASIIICNCYNCCIYLSTICNSLISSLSLSYLISVLSNISKCICNLIKYNCCSLICYWLKFISFFVF